jgi:hypothetical protein
MTKSLNDLLAVKDVKEMSTEELAELAKDISEASKALDDEDAILHALNNSLANDILTGLFNRGDVGPADAVDIALIMAVKMVIGNSKNHDQAAEKLAAVMNRMVDLCVKNLAQIGDEKAIFKIHRKKDLQ